MAALFDDVKDPKLTNMIKGGAIGVLPTDTLYGVVARADSKPAVNALYKLKKRDKKPGTVIAADLDQLVQLGFKARYLKAVEHFWPNPISVVVPAGEELSYLHLTQGGVALRLVKDKALAKLLEQTGPLLTSSANLAGKLPASNIIEAEQYFGSQLDFYVDGGDLSDRQPSTLIRIIDDAVEILRQGAVKVNEKGEIEQ